MMSVPVMVPAGGTLRWSSDDAVVVGARVVRDEAVVVGDSPVCSDGSLR